MIAIGTTAVSDDHGQTWHELRATPAWLPTIQSAPRLYRVALDAFGVEDVGVLDSQELARAGRFHFDRDRRRYVAAHIAVRQILARHLDLPAASVRFEHTPFGKPRVQGLEFNLSHSESLAVVAVSRHGEIGVDVERVVPLPGSESLDPTNSSTSLSKFYQMWCSHEAALKAEGVGLASDQRVRSTAVVRSFSLDHAFAEYVGAVASTRSNDLDRHRPSAGRCQPLAPSERSWSSPPRSPASWPQSRGAAPAKMKREVAECGHLPKSEWEQMLRLQLGRGK